MRLLGGFKCPPFLNTPNDTTFNCIIFFVLTNSYGHPHEETISRLNTIGSNIYVTAKCGQITLGIKDDELAVQGFLK